METSHKFLNVEDEDGDEGDILLDQYLILIWLVLLAQQCNKYVYLFLFVEAWSLIMYKDRLGKVGQGQVGWHT